jgi:four helix bundle protein
MRDPTNLRIWQRAVRLSALIAKAIPISAGRKSPGLRAQAIRAASAIAEAIAEGCGKNSDWELARYVNIGCGSVTELQTQLVLAQRHGILRGAQLKYFWRECSELRRMMVVFERKVRERAAQKDQAKKAVDSQHDTTTSQATKLSTNPP